MTVLHNHVWRKKTLRAFPWLPLENRKRKREDGGDDQEQKKNKPEEEKEVVLTMEEEILSESLPLLNVSYEEQVTLFGLFNVRVLSLATQVVEGHLAPIL